MQGSSISLTWSAPASNGGSDITDYIVEYELSTGGTWSVFADGTSVNANALVTGLSDGTSYNFRVSAVNIIGQSIPSNMATATPGEPAQVLIQSFPDLTVPSIGTAVRITNEGTSQYEYQYTWCVNTSATDACGSSGDVFSSTAAKLIQPGTNFDITATSTITVPGNYWFHIIVVYGSQSSTAVQSFTALATYPDAPTNVSATSTAGSSASISFTELSANGSAITGYTVTSNPGGLTAVGSTSPVILTGLTNGTAYTFTVTALNGVGTGSASIPSNNVTPTDVPDAPTNMTAVAGNAQIALSWTAPANDQGSSITDYVIEYKLSTDSTWLVFSDGISTLTTATVVGLTNNANYDFRVSAVNAIGQSAVDTISSTLPALYQTLSGGTSHSSGGSYVQIPSPSQTQPQTQSATSANVPIVTTLKTNSGQVNSITTTVNTKPITNRISAVPTENPLAEVEPISATTNPWKVVLIVLGSAVSGSGLIFLIAFIITRRKLS